MKNFTQFLRASSRLPTLLSMDLLGNAADVSLRSRVRLIEISTLLLFFIAIPFAIQYWLLGVYQLVFGLLLTMAGCLLNLWLLHRTGNPQLGGHLAISLLFVLLLLSNASSGGFYDPNFAWLYMVPLAAGVGIDLRAGWIWVGITLLTSVSFWYLSLIGFQVPDVIPPEQHALHSLFNRLSAIFAIGLLTSGFVIVQRRTEERLKESNERLAHEVGERLRAEAEARSASIAKSEFLTTISHELRTPLNTVIGVSGLLQDMPLEPQQSEYIEIIRDSADSLRGRINEVLDFASLDSGDLQLETVRFDLRRTIEDIVEYQAGAGGKDLDVVSWVSPQLPRLVLGDAGRFQQVLSLLLDNALKFSVEGEVVVHARKIQQTPGSVSVRLEVRDTGVGIASEDQARLFEPFQQLDSSMTRRHGGNGLGLSLVQALVRRLGGSVGVESEVGSGSIFWFSLRFGRPQDEDTQQAPSMNELRGHRGLLLANNPTIGALLEEYLGTWGMTLDRRSLTAKAIADLRSAAGSGWPYDLVVLDIHPLDIEGMAEAQSLLPGPKWMGEVRPVLLLPNQHHTTFEAPASSFVRVEKPFRFQSLYDSLRLACQITSSELHLSRTAVPGSGQRILVIDDNPLNQQAACRCLKRLGYRVDAVASGSEALDLLGQIDYGAVLLDYEIPDMESGEAAAALRQGAQGIPKLPIIGVLADPPSDGTLEVAGIDDWLLKPLSEERLAPLLDRWC